MLKILLHHSEAADPELIALMMDYLSHIFDFSPIILILRILKGKEDSSRFLEKYGFSSLEKNRNNLIWFHCCSVGELRSIIPLIKKIEKKYSKFRILVTTSTLSSSVVFEKEKFW